MDPTTNPQPKHQPILIGVAAALGALVVAGVAWTLVGLYIARTLAVGLILLPLVSGCGSGLLMRLGGGGLGRRVGYIAVGVTLAGCVIGDFFWFALVPSQKPIGQLLTTNIVDTLNVIFNLQKAVMYFFACYLAYALSNPPRVIVSD